MFRAYILLLALTLLGCETGSIASDKASQEETEVYAVYSVLINVVYADDSSTGLVIEGETSTYSLPYESLSEALQSALQGFPIQPTEEVVSAFLEKNKTRAELKDHFQSQSEYVILDKDTMSSIFGANKGWTEFLRRYPGRRLVTFSRIGFDEEFRHALVYTSSESGGKSGRSYYVLLTKRNGHWAVAHKLEFSVS